MKIGLAQINSWLGDFEGNAKKILTLAEKAKAEGCDLVVFPEAALFGYHPCDLLERPSVVEAQLKQLKKLNQAIPNGIGVMVGAIGKNLKAGKPYWNAAVLLEKNRRPRWFPKQLLPTYDVFDESRHIQPGQVKDNIFKWRGQRILVTICEDIWAWPDSKNPRYATYESNPIKDVKGKVDLVLNLSASPYTHTKLDRRERVVSLTAKHFRAPMIYVNMVGAQDELIFDGASFGIDARGRLLGRCGRFHEDFLVIDFKAGKAVDRIAKMSAAEANRKALILGIQDFLRKTGFQRVHLGLSGGIDSAVVACLAVEALGAERVTAVAMPGPFSDPRSLTEAQALAKNLKIECDVVPIEGLYEEFVRQLERCWGQGPFNVMHENVQARLRALVLMAYANKNKSYLLSTSNKSELATGYSTLYGDMCGALMVVGDLLKRDVYALAHHYNREKEIIPKFIIERPPSAELAPNQRDEDSLPPYDILDPTVERLVEGTRKAVGEVQNRILSLLMRSEFKRWQAPPILKISDHAFGRGRRFPLAHRAKD